MSARVRRAERGTGARRERRRDSTGSPHTPGPPKRGRLRHGTGTTSGNRKGLLPLRGVGAESPWPLTLTPQVWKVKLRTWVDPRAETVNSFPYASRPLSPTLPTSSRSCHEYFTKVPAPYLLLGVYILPPPAPAPTGTPAPGTPASTPPRPAPDHVRGVHPLCFDPAPGRRLAGLVDALQALPQSL